MDAQQQLQSGIAAMGLDIAPQRQAMLLGYLDLLEKWNAAYNLTALRDKARMVSHHLLDSLTLLPYLDGAATLIDVGSGGGMPGIPAAVCRPDLGIILCDANTKKTAFLRQAAIELGLDNVEVAAVRVEKLAGKKADIVSSRAFAELADFVSLTRSLPAAGGRWAAMKGVYPQEEIARLPPWVRVAAADSLEVPGLDAERHMVLLEEKTA
ncbi:Ribosomal RNA small subunit methyltransferase G [Kingella potus]|uniref:Ribosomal RNA small subunit methyltransferase G n=1 Tax=Kingella potus TaxID=265175 RepID=A0A377R037_9NEIS|nr:16S rRNA (guanine(527)-N(7))-methyltransferase RsmG [Kingella potus]UOP00953.1 16S rRNA (guanine(527)-N(7))-methyltransferase RsmG [Kingella potus]STR00612.1 Ribosomal RNA small subunit methyltransferase G [Kingella potus]